MISGVISGVTIDNDECLGGTMDNDQCLDLTVVHGMNYRQYVVRVIQESQYLAIAMNYLALVMIYCQ